MHKTKVTLQSFTAPKQSNSQFTHSICPVMFQFLCQTESEEVEVTALCPCFSHPLLPLMCAVMLTSSGHRRETHLTVSSSVQILLQSDFTAGQFNLPQGKFNLPQGMFYSLYSISYTFSIYQHLFCLRNEAETQCYLITRAIKHRPSCHSTCFIQNNNKIMTEERVKDTKVKR